MNAAKTYQNGGASQVKQTDLSAFVFGKVQPQVLQLEAAVLGALMLDSGAFEIANEVLRVSSFYTEAHQAIYAAISELNRNGKPIDILTVTEELRKKDKVETIGGSYYLVELTNRVGSAANIEYHSRIIAEAEIRRAMIQEATETIRNCYDDTQDTFDILESDSIRRAKVEDIPNRIAESLTLESVASQLIAQVEKAQQDGVVGISTGYAALDKITSGLQESKLIVLGARPSMGKSGFVVNLALNAASQNIRVVFFSLEMTNLEILGRMATAESGVSNEKLQGKDTLTEGDSDVWHQSLSDICRMPIHIIDNPIQTLSSMRGNCRKIKKQNAVKDGEMVVIVDYLQLMKGESTNRNTIREQEISEISRGLKGLSKQFKCTVIALSQLSRAVETRGGNKKPQLSDLRESGAIEQDADIVGFLYRPEYYQIVEDDNGATTKNQMQVLIQKNRGGALGDVLLNYQRDTQKITDWDIYQSQYSTPSVNAPQNNVIKGIRGTLGEGVDDGFTVDKKQDLPF